MDTAYFLQQLINGVTLGSVYGLIAIGYTMVYGIIGMINFAHGDIFMVGAFSFAAANIIAPFIYTQILWATMVGYIMFNAFPDRWSWTGILIVVTAGVYIAIREINLKKD